MIATWLHLQNPDCLTALQNRDISPMTTALAIFFSWFWVRNILLQSHDLEPEVGLQSFLFSNKFGWCEIFLFVFKWLSWCVLLRDLMGLSKLLVLLIYIIFSSMHSSQYLTISRPAAILLYQFITSMLSVGKHFFRCALHTVSSIIHDRINSVVQYCFVGRASTGISRIGFNTLINTLIAYRFLIQSIKNEVYKLEVMLNFMYYTDILHSW